MPLVSTDLRAWCVDAPPENDTATSGGPIDDTGSSSVPGVEPVFTQMAASDSIEVVSDGSDTRNITVHARLASGLITSQTVALTGTTPVELTTMGTVLYVLKAIVASADASRTVTVRRKNGGSPITIRTIEPTRRGFRLMFYDAASDESVQKIRFEGLYWVNHHASLALTNAKIRLSADPSTTIRQGIAASKGDVSTVTNRLTAPGGITFVDDATDQDVPSTHLAAGERIFVWYEQTLSAGHAAITTTNNTFTSRISGAGF